MQKKKKIYRTQYADKGREERKTKQYFSNAADVCSLFCSYAYRHQMK
jgi:hypothetical protein